MFRTRWVEDKNSWIIPLDLTGVVLRPPPSETSDPFTWDPVVQNSWKLGRVKSDKLMMTYHVAKPTVFRYNYLVADKTFLQILLGFFRSQGALEGLKREHLSTEEKRASATWYVIQVTIFGCGLTPGLIGGTRSYLDFATPISRILPKNKERGTMQRRSVCDRTDVGSTGR
jgi:hypothetical protein